jgi:hypothetical protein
MDLTTKECITYLLLKRYQVQIILSPCIIPVDKYDKYKYEKKQAKHTEIRRNISHTVA